MNASDRLIFRHIWHTAVSCFERRGKWLGTYEIPRATISHGDMY